MKKLLFILPILLLLTACGESKVVTENVATTPTETTAKSSEKEALLDKIEINDDDEKGVLNEGDKKISNIEMETNTPKALDCNETCSSAEKDTDGVVSEKECLIICNTGVENCQNKLNKDEITGDLLELCAVGELIKEVKVRYPDLESLF